MATRRCILRKAERELSVVHACRVPRGHIAIVMAIAQHTASSSNGPLQTNVRNMPPLLSERFVIDPQTVFDAVQF